MLTCKNRDRIIEYIKTHKDYTMRQVQRDLGIASISTVQFHLKKIKRIMQIESIEIENAKLRYRLQRCKNIMTDSQLIEAGF